MKNLISQVSVVAVVLSAATAAGTFARPDFEAFLAAYLSEAVAGAKDMMAAVPGPSFPPEVLMGSLWGQSPWDLFGDRPPFGW